MVEDLLAEATAAEMVENLTIAHNLRKYSQEVPLQTGQHEYVSCIFALHNPKNQCCQYIGRIHHLFDNNMCQILETCQFRLPDLHIHSRKKHFLE